MGGGGGSGGFARTIWNVSTLEGGEDGGGDDGAGGAWKTIEQLTPHEDAQLRLEPGER